MGKSLCAWHDLVSFGGIRADAYLAWVVLCAKIVRGNEV